MELTMKKIILILSYYFCNFSSCAGQLDSLTDEEIRRFFGRENQSAGIYGKVDLLFPTGLHGTSSVIQIPFSNGAIVDVHLKVTDGILADSSTPVWLARASPDTNNVTYTPYEGMFEKLGPLDFYQDFNTRCSLVVFHNLKRIEGFLGAYHFIQYNSYETPEGRLVTQHVLVQYGKTLTSRPSNNNYYPPMGRRGNRRVADAGGHSTTSPVNTLYPQLLIQAAYPEENETFEDTIIKILTQWNAVDMMYSNFSNPAVKINIAGVILPQDDVIMPWWRNVVNSTDDDYIKAVDLHGEHFAAMSDIFPSTDFDQLFAYFRAPPDQQPPFMGWARRGCFARQYSVAVLVNDMYNYMLPAHELGHVFGAKDETYGTCRGEFGIMRDAPRADSMHDYYWSSCAISSFEKFSEDGCTWCFRNCPRTKPDCHKSTRGL